MSLSTTSSFAALSALVLFSTTTIAAGPKDGTKEDCLDAHGRAQEQRERGQLTRARQTFLACAQPACPGLVQADCAKNAEELAQLVPTITFSARDASAADLPQTSVHVDGALVASRLEDGR